MKKEKILIPQVALFYFVLFLLAFSIDASEEIFKYPRKGAAFFSEMQKGILVGVGAGLLVVLLSRVALRYSSPFREVARRLSDMVGSLRWDEAFLMAAFSALGEEFLFRGVVQHYIGIVPASVLFGLLHTGPGKTYWPWTLFAIAVGFLLGGLYDWTGNLFSPVCAHFVVNFINLKFASEIRGQTRA